MIAVVGNGCAGNVDLPFNLAALGVLVTFFEIGCRCANGVSGNFLCCGVGVDVDECDFFTMDNDGKL